MRYSFMWLAAALLIIPQFTRGAPEPRPAESERPTVSSPVKRGPTSLPCAGQKHRDRLKNMTQLEHPQECPAEGALKLSEPTPAADPANPGRLLKYQ